MVHCTGQSTAGFIQQTVAKQLEHKVQVVLFATDPSEKIFSDSDSVQVFSLNEFSKFNIHTGIAYTLIVVIDYNVLMNDISFFDTLQKDVFYQITKLPNFRSLSQNSRHQNIKIIFAINVEPKFLHMKAVYKQFIYDGQLPQNYDANILVDRSSFTGYCGSFLMENLHNVDKFFLFGLPRRLNIFVRHFDFQSEEDFRNHFKRENVYLFQQKEKC